MARQTLLPPWFRKPVVPGAFQLFSLAVFLSLAQAAGADGPPQASPRRPNLLWIVAENIDLDLGCYGARHVRTPNLDRLAAQGVRFTRLFATAPVCAPSRSAFMT